MKARFVLALAMILVLIVAGSASVAADGAVVPFRASYHGGCQELDFDQETGIITYQVWGEGQATHLGMSDWSGVTHFNVYQDPPLPYWSDNITFTAANGDKLLGTMEGGITFPTVEGTFEITGGTGRFAGVTGSGTFWGWSDGTGSNDDIYYEGTLTK
jgi:hypothetical protein